MVSLKIMKKKIISIANDVINLEINALKKLKLSLNSSLDAAVDLLTNCQSKVIVCGVGKSGIIASKIAATLSSVGTPHLIFLLMIVVMVI